MAAGLGFQSQAQTQKGMVLIGTTTNLLGNLNQLSSSTSNNVGIQFGKSKTKYNYSSGNTTEAETKVTSFNLSPSVGYFVTDYLMIGTMAGVFYYNLKDEDDESFGFTAISFTPNVRAYFKTEGKFLPFAEVRGGIVSLKEKDADESESLTLFGGKVGGSMFLSPKVALDLFADYTLARNKEELNGGGEIKSTVGLFGLGLGLSIFL